MDSSNSQHSDHDHPPSTSQSDPGSRSRTVSGSRSRTVSGSDPSTYSHSGSGSGSGSRSGSGSGSRSGSRTISSSDASTYSQSGSGGSTGETSPSAGSDDQELPQEGGISTSSSVMGKSSSDDQPEDEEDMNVNTTDSKTPIEHELPESSAGKGKAVDATATSCGGGGEGKAEEIGLLADLYTFHNKTGRYLLSGEQDFYKFWIEEEREYANEEELDEKIDELHARFLKNMDKNVEGPTDPVDIEILRFSYWIWGHEIDSSEDEQEQDDDSMHLSDENAVDAADHGEVNRLQDSSQHHDGVDRMDED